jgi:hypothetical protein
MANKIPGRRACTKLYTPVRSAARRATLALLVALVSCGGRAVDRGIERVGPPAVARVGPAGGGVGIADGAAVVTVPAGALGKELTPEREHDCVVVGSKAGPLPACGSPASGACYRVLESKLCDKAQLAIENTTAAALGDELLAICLVGG